VSLAYGSSASAVSFDGNTRYIRITDINDDGTLNENKVSASEINEKYILNNGDILFARSGATVGKTFIYNENDGNCMYAGYLIRFIADSSKVLPGYVYHCTKSTVYRAFVDKNRSIASQPNINAQQYSRLRIPIPPLEEQACIVEILNKFDALTTDLTAGLPAEIAARQKQYEYYRDKLLTFPAKQDTANVTTNS